MKKFWLKMGILFLGVLWFFTAADAMAQVSPYDHVIGPYKFNFVTWHLNAWFDELWDVLSFQRNTPKLNDQEKIEFVREYFALPPEKRTGKMREQTENILREQIQTIVEEERIHNPFGKTTMFFPPLKFKLEQSPSVLVISPRDSIQTKERIILKPGIRDKTKTQIEDEIMKSGHLSAYVVNTGGVASYPSMVTERNLRSTINTISHEWVHHYLTFRPLGFAYLWWTITGNGNQEIVRINETVAGLVGNEIGGLVYERYYREGEMPQERIARKGRQERTSLASLKRERSGPLAGKEPKIDFAREMRIIRKQVDEFLFDGKIEEAELYMNERRDWLERAGFYIRRLNQAYFAFHGSYESHPAYRDVVGKHISRLRAQSQSLKDFLDTVSGITNLEELKEKTK